MAGINAQGLDEPVVEGPVDIEFQGADAVGDVLYGVALAVGEVVHGVDAPLVTGTVMMRKLDAVKERVTEHHVGMGHVYLCAEHLFAFGILAGLHFTEQPQVLFHGTVSPGAGGAGLVHGTAVFPDLVLSLVVNIRKAALDKFFGPLIKLVKVIRRIKLLIPLETKPFDVFLDGIHVLGVFLCGVGVVVAEIGFAAVLLGQAEVEANALCMTKVKVPVGLRGETGDDGIYLSLCEVLLYYLFDEIKFTLFHKIILTVKGTKKKAHICDKKFFSNFAC